MEISEFLIKKTGLENILDFIYPPQCLVCGDYADRADRLLCSDCLDSIVHREMPFCLNCGIVMESDNNCPNCSPADSIPVFALGDYIDPLREIVHQFKYHGFRMLGRYLAASLADDYQDSLKQLDIEYLVPVPLHGFRLKTRGFNQAAILADIIGIRMNIPVNTESLGQIRRTKDQARLKPDDRSKNIRDAFGVYDDELVDKRVVIVDDVITTGATLKEIKRILEESGAKPVGALVIAAAGN
jgi:ComF family protein